MATDAEAVALFRKELELCDVGSGTSLAVLSEGDVRAGHAAACLAAAAELEADAFQVNIKKKPGSFFGPGIRFRATPGDGGAQARRHGGRPGRPAVVEGADRDHRCRAADAAGDRADRRAEADGVQPRRPAPRRGRLGHAGGGEGAAHHLARRHRRDLPARRLPDRRAIRLHRRARALGPLAGRVPLHRGGGGGGRRKGGDRHRRPALAADDALRHRPDHADRRKRHDHRYRRERARRRADAELHGRLQRPARLRDLP